MENNNFDKFRLPIAVVLSGLLFLAFLQFQTPKPKPGIKPTTPSLATNGTTTITSPQSATLSSSSTSKLSKTPSLKETFSYLSNDFLNITFSSINAAVSSSSILLESINTNYANKPIDLEMGHDPSYRTGSLVFNSDLNGQVQAIPFEVSSVTSNSITFKGHYDLGGNYLNIVKKYTLVEYQLLLDISFNNPTQTSGNILLVNGSSLGRDSDMDVSSSYDLTAVGYTTPDQEIKDGVSTSFFSHAPDQPFGDNFEPAKWLSIDNRFFTRILLSKDANYATQFKIINFSTTNTKPVGAFKVPYNLEANKDKTFSFSFYYLPKSRALLNEISDKTGFQFYQVYRQFDWMRFITEVMYWIIIKFDLYIKNFGISILVMTFAIKLATYPLTQKSMDSMQKMGAINPKIKAIRDKYKKDPQKANKEIMAMYKKEKINPALGCLPMLIPIPIFIALYRLFPNMVELNYASFLWIADLSLPDQAFVFSTSLPLIGTSFHLLPVLMGVSQFIQTYITPTQPAANEAAEMQQKIMKYFFPIFFLFICWNLPSALVLFWFYQNIFTIFQTLITRKKKVLS